MADRLPQPSALIFDFDGTLADSLLIALEVLYRLAHQKPLPAEDISAVRGMTLLQVLRQLNVAPWRALLLRGRTYRAMARRLHEIEPVPGMAETLRTLSRQHPVYIVSSNDAANVHKALRRFGLTTEVRAVVGRANPLSKARALRRLAIRYNLDIASTWYIGDQASDIRAAHRAGMRAAAVSWGFSNLRVLENAQPDLLVCTPEELVARFS